MIKKRLYPPCVRKQVDLYWFGINHLVVHCINFYLNVVEPIGFNPCCLKALRPIGISPQRQPSDLNRIAVDLLHIWLHLQNTKVGE